MESILKTGMIALTLALFAAGSAVPGTSADTPTQPTVENGKRCIDLSRIRETDVIDDQTILFRMNGNKTYRNRLPHRCPMLGVADGFSYRTSLHRLCNVDGIRVLRYGMTCSLGLFEPHDVADETEPEDERDERDEEGI